MNFETNAPSIAILIKGRLMFLFSYLSSSRGYQLNFKFEPTNIFLFFDVPTYVVSISFGTIF